MSVLVEAITVTVPLEAVTRHFEGGLDSYRLIVPNCSLRSDDHLTALSLTTPEDVASFVDKLEALGHSAAASDLLLPVETVLADIPALALTTQEANRLRHGQGVAILPVASRSSFKDISPGNIICAMADGKLVALAKIAGGEIRPVRVMNF